MTFYITEGHGLMIGTILYLLFSLRYIPEFRE